MFEESDSPKLPFDQCLPRERSPFSPQWRGLSVAELAKSSGFPAKSQEVYATSASAPVKAFDQEGESPFQANVTSLNNKSNCVAVRQGGEQLELNDQSVTK